MGTDSEPTPDRELDRTDPGDDTQRRFRYQATYAAIIALGLLHHDSELLEVFCEHHEDILARRKDGTFAGIQVKTRIEGRNPFKSHDSDVLHTVRRFVELFLDYPSHFSRFVLATNHGFWRERKTDFANLDHVLQLAKESCASDRGTTHEDLSRYVELVRKSGLRSSCTVDTVLRVLSMIELQGNLPKLDHIPLQLVRDIANISIMSDANYFVLLRAAEALVSETLKAASLAHVSPKQAYISLCSDPSAAHVDDTINGKRITKDTVERILNESLSEGTCLAMVDNISIASLPKGMRNLELKMAAGGISAPSISATRDHKYSAERLFNEWIYRRSPKKADECYQQVTVIVSNECQEAHDVAYCEDRLYGQNMLNDVRQRLRARYQRESKLFFDAKYEHLLGVAAILTERCDVWWSKEFDLPDES